MGVVNCGKLSASRRVRIVAGVINMSVSLDVGKIYGVYMRWLVSCTAGGGKKWRSDTKGVTIGVLSSNSYSWWDTLTTCICGVLGGGSGSGGGSVYSKPKFG